MSFENKKVFDEAIWAVAPEVKRILLFIDNKIKDNTYEIRLRIGRPIILITKDSSVYLNKNSSVSYEVKDDTYFCSLKDISDTFNRLCSYSIHTHQADINNGFITVKGGHRVGIAGTAVINSKGEITSLKDISSLNIRIARNVCGCSSELISKCLYETDKSLIIAGPPSCGKTTLLKDVARSLSMGLGCKNKKVVIADERQELAFLENGMPDKYLGYNCDVLSSYPKDKAILTALRTLSPEYIICDEIGSFEEIAAISQGVNSGCRFIVTVHVGDYDELLKRKQIELLLETYSFEEVVLLSKDNVCTIDKIISTEDLRDEISRRRAGFNYFGIYGDTFINAS